MKARKLVITSALIGVVLLIAGTVVPPYGAGAGQLLTASGSPSPSPPLHQAPAEASPGKALIQGTLRDSSGRPLAGAVVVAGDLKNGHHEVNFRHRTSCDSEGRFRLEVEPAEHWIVFRGGPLRVDRGHTSLGTLKAAADTIVNCDFQLAGDATLLAEVQLERTGGIGFDVELLDSEGNLLAAGGPRSGATPLYRATAAVKSLFGPHQDFLAVDGWGLCLEGLPAGDHCLRLHLNREQELTIDVPVTLEAGQVLDLRRLTFSIADFTSARERAREERKSNPSGGR